MIRTRTAASRQNPTRSAPFPPLPVEMMSLPQRSARHFIPAIVVVTGSIGLLALLIFLTPWNAIGTAFQGVFQSFQPRTKPAKSPKIKTPTSMGKTQVVQKETVAEAPPPSPIPPKPNANFLVGRYPVRKYTDIRMTVGSGARLFYYVRTYGDQIFPKKYRDYRQLGQYNRINPPNYALEVGQEFLIPTAEHIVAPKEGYEVELEKIQSELNMKPTNAALLNQQAMLEFKRNELDKALATLQQAIKLSPNDGALHNNLGFIYLITEEDKPAKAELEAAIAQSKNPGIPHCNLGLLHMEAGKFDLAIGAFERALQADESLLDAKYNLAIAYEKAGRIDLARQHLMALNAILPDDAQVKSALERMSQ